MPTYYTAAGPSGIVSYTTLSANGTVFPFPKMTADLINATWNLGVESSNALAERINDVGDMLETPDLVPAITAGSVTTPTITEPAVDIPSTQSATDIMSLFDTKYMELIGELVARFTSFRTDFFPDEASTYTAAETWLSDALADPSGLPAAVAAQIVTDDKDRIVADAARATDAVIAQFAARRFPLPPGAAAAATIQIQQKAQDEIATSSRKVVIASIEQLRFVIQQTMGLRQMAMSTAIEYIKALASGPDTASRLVGIGYDAQSKLISAASQFYNSRIAAAEAVSKVGQYNVGAALQAAEKNQTKDLTLIEDRVKVLLTECQAIAQMATSLFNNLHASTSVTSSSSVSETTSY